MQHNNCTVWRTMCFELEEVKMKYASMSRIHGSVLHVLEEKLHNHHA